MMREDGRLKLAGYDVYRFGGHELRESDVGGPLLSEFFTSLLSSSDVSLDR
jgi:hypothetical protein